MLHMSLFRKCGIKVGRMSGPEKYSAQIIYDTNVCTSVYRSMCICVHIYVCAYIFICSVIFLGIPLYEIIFGYYHFFGSWEEMLTEREIK